MIGSRSTLRAAAVALAGLLLALPGRAELSAQIDRDADVESAPEIRFGGQLSYALGVPETIRNADLGIGGRVDVSFDLSDVPLRGIGTLDFFFPGQNLSYREINANLAYRIPVPHPDALRPYLGAGLGLVSASNGSSESEMGLNLLGGLEIPIERTLPFVEVRLEVGGGEQLVLTGGLLF